jgi:hypothetical protein
MEMKRMQSGCAGFAISQFTIDRQSTKLHSTADSFMENETAAQARVTQILSNPILLYFQIKQTRHHLSLRPFTFPFSVPHASSLFALGSLQSFSLWVLVAGLPTPGLEMALNGLLHPPNDGRLFVRQKYWVITVRHVEVVFNPGAMVACLETGGSQLRNNQMAHSEQCMVDPAKGG